MPRRLLFSHFTIARVRRQNFSKLEGGGKITPSHRLGDKSITQPARLPLQMLWWHARRVRGLQPARLPLQMQAMPEMEILSPSQRIRGVLAPVVTPFKADLSPDSERFLAHCRWLLSQNCGLAVFGTNSEANSLSMEERAMLLDELVAAGINASRMMPGTGCCSIMETVKLTAQAVEHGCAGVLMLPPFYYKDVSEEGLYRYFSEVVQRVGDARLKIYLYHIPPVAVVGITTRLVERLLAAYPNAIAGMKDGSGDWNNTKTFLDAVAVLDRHGEPAKGLAATNGGAARTFVVVVGIQQF